MNTETVKSQVIGGIVQTVNDIRQEDLQNILNQINDKTREAISNQDYNFARAISRIENVQQFVDSPDRILGSVGTKHGEIAEQVEVGITNARAALHGLSDRATADPNIVGRTVNAPADYLVDGKQVQSKFINGELNTLKHVFEHLKKYEDINYARGDGSYYHIPKDQYNKILKIFTEGELEGRNQRSINAIVREIKKIEAESGQKFTDIVKAANSDYGDVQLGKIQETLDNYREEIIDENNRILTKIKDEHKNEKNIAEMQHQVSFGEAVKVGAIAAAVGGGMTFIIDVYKKKKEGKKISEFTPDDWQDIGLDSAKNTIKGGITGLSVYGLTNLANMSAPCASGLVSVVYGMSSLLADYRNGKMKFDDFVENGEVLCIDTGVATLGSIVGQMIIPIPVVGAVVGSVVSNVFLDVSKNLCNEKEQELLNSYRKRLEEQFVSLEKEYKIFVEQIITEYRHLGGIMKMAFNYEINYQLRFVYSQQLALSYGVSEAEILRDQKSIDEFFLN